MLVDLREEDLDDRECDRLLGFDLGLDLDEEAGESLQQARVAMIRLVIQMVTLVRCCG